VATSSQFQHFLEQSLTTIDNTIDNTIENKGGQNKDFGQLKFTKQQHQIVHHLNQLINRFAKESEQHLSLKLNTAEEKVQLVDVMHAISQGDLTKKVQAKGESDRLSLAINQVVDNLTDTANKVDAIAQGDLTNKVQAKGGSDRLSLAINQVVDNLTDTA
jgi:ribosome-associated translation inhibitor RaiA